MGELDGDERLSLAGAQAFLEEEENEVSTGLAKKSHEVSEQLDISTFAQPDRELWLVLLMGRQRNVDVVIVINGGLMASALVHPRPHLAPVKWGKDPIAPTYG